jgi:hypothetical protein
MINKISFFITFLLALTIAFVFASVVAYPKSAFAQIIEDTFSAKGRISSLVSSTNESMTTTATLGGNTSNSPTTIAFHNKTIGTTPSLYKLAGTWRLNVKGGNVTYFEASFVMSHDNATNHSNNYGITNFHVENGSYIQLYSDGTAFIPGTVDIKTNGLDKWKNVNATIVIDKLTAMEIVLDSNKTNFKDPIRGVTDSLTDHLGKQIAMTTSNNGTATPSGSTLTGPPSPPIGAYVPRTNPSSQPDKDNNINPSSIPSTNTQSQTPSSNQINPHLPTPVLPRTNTPVLPFTPSQQPEPSHIAPPFRVPR